VSTAAPERPWTASYEDGVPAEIVVPDEPLTAALERAARDPPARVALDFMGAVTTYLDLKHPVDVAAQALLDLDVRPGDRVAIILPNCSTHVVGGDAAPGGGADKRWRGRITAEHCLWGKPRSCAAPAKAE